MNKKVFFFGFLVISLGSLLSLSCQRHIVKVTLQIPTNARVKLENVKKVAVLDFLSSETQFDPGKGAAKQLREELNEKMDLEIISREETDKALAQVKSESTGIVLKEGEYFQKVGYILQADALFGGAIQFEQKDLSGYTRKEFVDSRTGTIYYRDVWEEKVGLLIEMEIYIVRPVDGEFLFKEKFTDETTLDRENSSTALYGFHDLIDNQVRKFMLQLSQQERSENRYLLR
ncbi:hypothetical protein ACFL27_16760 [candidate division CSSED10-310 bacterium]|uniref:Curli production assembly/transport component CsgG n=1 Tax=candidate division CSSED10-310 bacterium TaxID=2855610 RepID=A0ABV6Z074_UNCC1